MKYEESLKYKNATRYEEDFINRGCKMQEMEGAVTYDNDNRSENKNVLTNDCWHKCTHIKTQGQTDMPRYTYRQTDR